LKQVQLGLKACFINKKGVLNNPNSIKKKRELSKLQQGYRDFFLAVLDEYFVDSPAKLTYNQKIEFFNRIKKEWRIRKAVILRSEVEKAAPSKKAQYATVKVPRRTVPLEPKSSYEPTTPKFEEEEVLKIHSEENDEQTNDLRIKFNPNQFFEQGAEYNYPVVKMPDEGSLLKLPRQGRAMGKGYKEDDFFNAVTHKILGVDVQIDVHLTIPFYNRPYEPDIVLVDKRLNLYLDIEIDEPYDGHYRFPTHEFSRKDQNSISKKDHTRDLFFTESGWIVIRFTERQVHLQETECINYIKDVLNSIYSYRLEETSNCISEKQWDYQQAVRWEKEHYREKYLGIEQFGKNTSKSEIIVNTDVVEEIETGLSRTIQLSQTNLQDNIGFEEESHKYHHPKNQTGNADYISVTTLIDRFFPFDMDRFIQGKAKKEDTSEKKVLEEFLKNRDDAAEKGTYLHEQIENFLNGDQYDASSKEFVLFKEFYEKIVVAKGFEFVESEKRILLEKYNIAGTVDAIFKKPNKDQYLIVDWKRTKKLVVDGHPKKYGYGYALSELSHLDNSSYYKYALQQNIYKFILENNYGMPISSMNLIVLHENFEQYYRIDLMNMEKEVWTIFESINHKI
jgi:hypothetical protein